MTLTFALSVRNFIEDIGAYAGFAAVVAVALFALLLFAQAREIKRLRDWGADAHDRIGELERSVAAALDMARRAAAAPRAAQTQAPVQPAARGQAQRGRTAAAAAAATPAGGPARVARTAAPVRPQLLPSAPANVGGPALASATVLIPLPGAPESAAPPQPPVPARPARPAVAAAATGAGARERAVPAAAAAAPPREREADAGANGHRDDPPTELPPRRATPAPARPAPPRREPARPGARPRPAAAGRPQPGGPARGGGRPAAAEPEPPHGRRRLVGVLIAVLALVVIGVGAFLVLGRGDDEPSRSAQVVQPEGNATRTPRRAARQQQRAPAGPARDQVVVTVLNGTGVTGLASRVMGELTADGYRQGPIGDASDAARGVTVVEYRNNQEAAANEVARVLGLTPDTVSAIRPDSETAACAIQAPEPCTAQVVVTVGADRNPTTTTP